MAYNEPTPADLKARYPAFASVLDATVQTYLTDASGPGGDVDQSWPDGTYQRAVMAAAAHRMARAGVLASSAGVSGMAAAGVTDFKSGSFEASFSADAIKSQIAGGWASTPYGQDYADLLRRFKGGPRVIGGGVAPCGGGYNGWAGPLSPLTNC
jgi:hypothetical protein